MADVIIGDCRDVLLGLMDLPEPVQLELGAGDG